MKIARLTPFLSVSPQIAPTDLGTLAALGFKAVISNRPDREADDQPASADIAAAAERVGLAYRHIPVVSGKVSDDDVAGLRRRPSRAQGASARFLPHGHALEHTLGAFGGRSSRSGGDPRHHGRGRLRPFGAAAAARGSLAHGRADDPARACHGFRPRRGPRRGHRRRRIGRARDRGEPAQAAPVARHRRHRAARAPLLPARLDAGRRRRVRPSQHRAADGRGDARGGQVDTRRGQRVRARAQPRGPRGRRAGRLPDPGRRTRDRAELGRGRGPAGDPRQERRHLQLPLRDGALHVGAGAHAQGRPRAVHPAADADQVRRRAAKGDVSRLRPLAPARCARRDRGRVPHRDARAVRRQGVRAAADGVREEIRRGAELQLQSQGGRRSGQEGLVRGQARRRCQRDRGTRVRA